MFSPSPTLQPGGLSNPAYVRDLYDDGDDHADSSGGAGMLSYRNEEPAAPQKALVRKSSHLTQRR